MIWLKFYQGEKYRFNFSPEIYFLKWKCIYYASVMVRKPLPYTSCADDTCVLFSLVI